MRKLNWMGVPPLLWKITKISNPNWKKALTHKHFGKLWLFCCLKDAMKIVTRCSGCSWGLLCCVELQLLGTLFLEAPNLRCKTWSLLGKTYGKPENHIEEWSKVRGHTHLPTQNFWLAISGIMSLASGGLVVTSFAKNGYSQVLIPTKPFHKINSRLNIMWEWILECLNHHTPVILQYLITCDLWPLFEYNLFKFQQNLPNKTPKHYAVDGYRNPAKLNI